RIKLLRRGIHLRSIVPAQLRSVEMEGIDELCVVIKVDKTIVIEVASEPANREDMVQTIDKLRVVIQVHKAVQVSVPVIGAFDQHVIGSQARDPCEISIPDIGIADNANGRETVRIG